MGARSKSISRGDDSFAIALGRHSIVSGGLGDWLICAEYDKGGSVKAVVSARVDGKKIKPDTWYKAKNGMLVEAD